MLRNFVVCVVTWLIAGINQPSACIAINQSQAADFALQNASVAIGMSGSQIDASNAGKAIGTERSQFCKYLAENVCIVESQIFACLILAMLTLRKRTSQRTEVTRRRFG